ncbi:hypothetical protein HPO96_28665 [Kribbella sandramycini]|uniref:Uncharacterized protein n=1 Tax=Kribbella sandramycini TaxID=60450 RepID=A0A7Y4L4K6_9ACTN|nr:hypothetical protein [Kribbella sandramycini]MBB6571581.1 hypothetical protein [Kribbella sandramycini]NOL44227.1 hypothetical protein [Kribbella sandramycini]
MSIIGVVASAIGGLDQLTDGLIRPLLERGHQPAVTFTPTAAGWQSPDTFQTLELLTGLAVRSQPRRPAWAGHLGVLRQAGVVLVEWELLEPREAHGRRLPWGRVLAAVDAVS